MTKNDYTIDLLLVSKDEGVIEATQAFLANEQNYNLIQRIVTSDNLFSIISETHPDIVLLDFDFQDNPYYLVDRIVTKFNGMAVVAILSQSEREHVDRVVLSGARAFVHYPYQKDKLLITIRRVMELLERNQTGTEETIDSSEFKSEANKMNTFTVFSPKGGVGTTTIAANLAISLHKNFNEEVLLIDGKLLFGHIALYLNLLTGNSITDLIAHAGMLDEQLIRQVVVKHNSGIHVLPCPSTITEAQGIKPESLFTVLQGLQQVYSTIIIDGGNELNENSVTFMDASDKILLVLNPDLASLRDVKQFIEISSTLSYPREKLLMLLNLTGRKADMQSHEIEGILEKEIFGSIPADENFALSCLNEGIPIIQKKPRHSISKAFDQISKDLGKMLETSEADTE